MADARGDLGAVLLDLHPAAAPVAELAASEVTVDVLWPYLKPRREALHERGEARAVRLPGSHEAKLHAANTLLARVGSSAGHERFLVELDQLRPSQQSDEAAQCQEGAKWERLLAGCGALAKHDPGAGEGAAEKGEEQRRRHRRTEVEARGPGELDVAHPDAAGADERRHEQQD